MEKVILPNEVAEAIENLKNICGYSSYYIICMTHESHEDSDDVEATILREYVKENAETLMSALVNGYEAEQTPEDRIYNLYSTAVDEEHKLGDHPQAIYWKGKKQGILDTLLAQNKEVKGVND